MDLWYIFIVFFFIVVQKSPKTMMRIKSQNFLSLCFWSRIEIICRLKCLSTEWEKGRWKRHVGDQMMQLTFRICRCIVDSNELNLSKVAWIEFHFGLFVAFIFLRPINLTFQIPKTKNFFAIKLLGILIRQNMIATKLFSVVFSFKMWAFASSSYWYIADYI